MINDTETPKGISRREFLAGTGALGLSALLSACGLEKREYLKGYEEVDNGNKLEVVFDDSLIQALRDKGVKVDSPQQELEVLYDDKNTDVLRIPSEGIKEFDPTHSEDEQGRARVFGEISDPEKRLSYLKKNPDLDKDVSVWNTARPPVSDANRDKAGPFIKEKIISGAGVEETTGRDTQISERERVVGMRVITYKGDILGGGSVLSEKNSRYNPDVYASPQYFAEGWAVGRIMRDKESGNLSYLLEGYVPDSRALVEAE